MDPIPTPLPHTPAHSREKRPKNRAKGGGAHDHTHSPPVGTGRFPFHLRVGSLLHFVFAWTGGWVPAAWLAAVNESTWEHLKMGFWPGLLFALVEYGAFGRGMGNFWLAKTLGLFAMPIAVITLFYGTPPWPDGITWPPTFRSFSRRRPSARRSVMGSSRRLYEGKPRGESPWRHWLP